MNHDPTRIDIDWYDPTQNRMRGIARHGNTPFDVPYISEVTPTLWQGGCSQGLVLPQHIRHVVSLYPWEKYTRDHGTYREFKMYDSHDVPDRENVEEIADYVNECRKTGVTLVHCQAGLNRSGLIAGLALIRGDGMTPEDAIKLLRDSRSPAVLCNTSFHDWLLRYG